MLKNKFLLVFIFLFTSLTYSQIPYFGKSHKSDSFYGYHSFKISDTSNHYTTFQYGITDYISVGTDLYDGSDFGSTLRLGLYESKIINFGVQSTAVFNIKNNWRYSYQSTGIFINGYITKNIFYVYNNWLTNLEYDNWIYLGLELGNLSILGGYTDSSKISGGLYYSIKRYIIYGWYNQNKVLTIGLDFKL